MLKPEHVTKHRLRKLLQRAYYSATSENDTGLTVRDGLPCVVNIQFDEERQFVRLYAYSRLSHLEETEIVAATCRLNASYFLVKFIAGKDTLSMSYELPFSEGLNPATFIRLMRRFAKISAEALETLPKPLADMRPEEIASSRRLH